VTRPTKRPCASHAEAAASAKATPGEWVVVGAYRSAYSAKSTASHIRAGGRINWATAYAPAGSFETRTVNREFDTELHIRYVAAGGAQ
jgi:hypothetical protein